MKIRVSFFGVLMLVALVITRSYLSLAALFAAFLHEMGHIAAAKLCNIPLKELKLDIFGASITPESSFCSYKQEILLAAAGPAVNLLLCAALLPFYASSVELCRSFFVASLFLGGLNLLPIESFDGGRVLYCVLALIFAPSTARRVCACASFLLVFALWTLSVYLLLRLGASLSLFVFSYALICKMFASSKS